MPPPVHHLLLFCAVVAFSGLSAGNAFASDGGPGGERRGQPNSNGGGSPLGGGGGNGGPPSGSGNGNPGGPPPGGGPGPESHGGNFGAPSPGTPSRSDRDSSQDRSSFRFNGFHFGNRRDAPPPTGGDGGQPASLPNLPLAPNTNAPALPGFNPGFAGKRRDHDNIQLVRAPVLDQEQSKQAIRGGKAASMPLLLTYLDQKYPGQVLDVKLHTTPEGLVYEVRYLSNIVELRTIFLDAMTLSQK